VALRIRPGVFDVFLRSAFDFRLFGRAVCDLDRIGHEVAALLAERIAALALARGCECTRTKRFRSRRPELSVPSFDPARAAADRVSNGLISNPDRCFPTLRRAGRLSA